MRPQEILPLLLATFLFGCLPLGPKIQTDGVHGANNYLVQLWANTPCPQPHDMIILRAKVTNDGPQSEVASTVDEPVFDIVVKGESETLRWSDGKPLTDELTRLRLEPGEFKSIQLEFPYAGGVYGVEARFVYDTRSPYDVIEPGFTIQSLCGNY